VTTTDGTPPEVSVQEVVVPTESGQPICCEDGLGDDFIAYFADVRAIDQRGS